MPSLTPLEKNNEKMRWTTALAAIAVICLPTLTSSLVSPQPSFTKLRQSPSSSSRIHGVRRTPVTENDTAQEKPFLFPFDPSHEKPIVQQARHLGQKRTPVNLGVKKDEEEMEGMSPELMAAGALVAFATTVAGIYTATNMDYGADDLIAMVQGVAQNPSAALDLVVQKVADMGPLGAVYFGVAYTIAEVLAIPAIPLTASAGYLFGPVEGTAVVLLSASIAAAISFVIGRTLLRDYVEKVLEEYPKFSKIDRAIGKEGFKLMLLLRLSPIFPFALSNYLYGASSINFSAFFWGTLFGFTPGTIAYVYTGYVGKALTDGGDSAYPWFVYAGGLAIFAGFLKVVADTASRVVDELEDDGV